MTALRYRSFVAVEALALDECTIHAASNDKGARWWLLWFHVARETDGQPEFFAVPVAPNRAYTETGAGGRTWGLKNAGPGLWQVSPSINVLNDQDARRVVAGHAPTGRSIWHQTPSIVGVPSGESWIAGQP